MGYYGVQVLNAWHDATCTSFNLIETDGLAMLSTLLKPWREFIHTDVYAVIEDTEARGKLL